MTLFLLEIPEKNRKLWSTDSLLAEVSHDEVKMRGRRETSEVSLLPLILSSRERPLLPGKSTDRLSNCVALQFVIVTLFIVILEVITNTHSIPDILGHKHSR